jgi:hypothetical protein
MNTCSILNNKIRKAHIRIVVYMLILMMLQAKAKTCTMLKYKRSGTLTFTVSRFLFFVASGLKESRVLYKTSMNLLALPLTVKDISQHFLC